jgi:lincosamide and streptogramin A transport system ATP-binding/permease protein
MALIALEQLGYHYEDPYNPVFSDLNLGIDTAWKTGMVGRNGRGKTTLLNLLRGRLEPTVGCLSMPVAAAYFPYEPPVEGLSVARVIKASVAPFEQWEERMQRLLEKGDEPSIEAYGELASRFERLGGYQIDDIVAREAALLGLGQEALVRPFATLSGGERTRALIIALFLRRDRFPLIDEPTNHLDMDGRQSLGRYLARQRGFVLVSHDRHFLDLCTDHILSLNRADTRLNQGNFSNWKSQMEREEETQRRTQAKLQREVRALKQEARRRRDWSDRKEKSKIGAYDKGRIGHLAAKTMKKALNAERRIRDKLEAKQELLQNREKERVLKLDHGDEGPETLLALDGAYLRLGDKELLDGLSLRLRHGERLAISGANGTGKTALLRVLCGELPLAAGTLLLPAHVRVCRSHQIPLWQQGLLRPLLAAAAIDETRFRTLMGSLGVQGEIFERPLESFSEGQRKKVDLCRSFLAPADLLVWDEPLNYLDLDSREQIERVVLEYRPTLLFVEHDCHFTEKVATDVVVLRR